MRLRAEIAISAEYDADPENYGTDDPRVASNLDVQNADDDLYGFLDFLMEEPGTTVIIKVNPA